MESWRFLLNDPQRDLSRVTHSEPQQWGIISKGARDIPGGTELSGIGAGNEGEAFSQAKVLAEAFVPPRLCGSADCCGSPGLFLPNPSLLPLYCHRRQTSMVINRIVLFFVFNLSLTFAPIKSLRHLIPLESCFSEDSK